MSILFPCVDTYRFHVLTPSRTCVDTSCLYEITGHMCSHFKPSLFSWNTLSPSVDTFWVICRHLIISFQKFGYYPYLSTLSIRHFLHFGHFGHCLHVSILYKGCVNTFYSFGHYLHLSTLFKACVDTLIQDSTQSTCVDSFSLCVDTYFSKFKTLFTYFRCLHL